MTCVNSTRPDIRLHLIRPKPGSFSESRRKKVFARIADHAAMGNWIPLVQKVTVTHPRPLAPGESTIGTTPFITLKGGMEIVEKVVYWNPPYCYAYTSEGKHFPFKNYVGLFQVEPTDAQSGRFIFREYFDELGHLEQAILPHGVIALCKQVARQPQPAHRRNRVCHDGCEQVTEPIL